ncbi:MAG: cytochrome P450 [Bacteroidales bacterium]|nr:cytochrome P450 [Bacteroidales bacterium]
MFTKPIDQAIPDHVPADLVWDHDLDTFNSELDDPYLAASRLHQGPDIIWARSAMFGHPTWVLTRHDHIKEAYGDPERFSSDRNNLGALGVSWKLNPLEFDPPEHHYYRRILNPHFTPTAVTSLDGAVRDACGLLMDRIAARGSCEFIGEFAELFPSYIFLDLMGLPHDMLPQFLIWERDMMRSPEPAERVTAMRAILAYLEDFVAEQMKNPGSSLLKGIVASRYRDERPLTKDEVLGMCYLFYIGGLDTVYSSLGWYMRHLANDWPLQERLRNNPDDIPRAVEELLRAYPVAAPHRTVKKDIEFHGVRMRKGEDVLLPTYLAGRDPLAYPEPHRVDIDRNPRHLAFGSGPHNCLGMHLARRELKTVLAVFLSRCHNIRIPAGESCSYHVGSTFGVDRLPLEWDQPA